jgi:murein DD-endopeptidase MepM/ murein hydrolase activator NlpD
VSRRWLALVVIFVLLGPVAAVAAPEPSPGEWSPPVDGPVARGYEPPAGPFGPRHLGLDFAVAPGAPVRAAGDGIVVFAGRTGRSWGVAVAHPGARRTTYAYLRRIEVTPGRPVRRGAVLGESGGTGPGHGPGVLHFGYRVGGRPQDPAPLFGSPPPRISLAPLDRPACPASLGGASGGPARLGGNPTPPGREFTRPHSNGVRP